MYKDYANPCFEKLRDQLIDSESSARLVGFADKAEQLLHQLNPSGVYSCGDLCERLGAESSESERDERVTGEALQHDLRRFIEDLTDAAGLRAADVGETVHTVDELAKMFNVSTKTISRWRMHGLVARKFLFEGRKRPGFLRSSVQRFVAENSRLVKRAGKFRQLTDSERRAVIEEARRLMERGLGRTEMLRRVARSFRKSMETIRQTVRRHDEENPAAAIYASGGLNLAARQRIYRRYTQGESIESLARRFYQSQQQIHRVIALQRLENIQQLPLDFIPSREFETQPAGDELLGPPPESDKPPRAAKAPKHLPTYLASLYETPLLTREQEHHLFRKYNYLKYRASQLRLQLDTRRPQTRLMDDIEQLYEQAERVKQELVKANMRLVVSIAKRYVSPTQDLPELISDGNISLMRAVEKFDYSRGFKFSTYATWAIVKNFARSLAAASKQQTRFRTSHGEMLGAEIDATSHEASQLAAQAKREHQVNRIMRHLNDREQQIVAARFGLNEPFQPQTLKDIGKALGVSKERVRQLERRALWKLRGAAEQEAVSPDDSDEKA